MADLKTQPSDASVAEFIAALPDLRRRSEAPVLAELMARTSGAPPVVWGGAMIGFGRYNYTYASGRSGSFFLTGFRPARARITVHIMPGFAPYTDALSRLGPHRHAKSCLYISALARIDLTVLEEIVADSVIRMRSMYPD